MTEQLKRFKFGWYGDNGLGERLIGEILAGRKTATCCPAYDPEDSDLKAGDKLELVDKHGKIRGQLVVTRIEFRNYGDFDEALASKEGATLEILKAGICNANGRQIRDDEEMRITHFALVKAGVPA